VISQIEGETYVEGIPEEVAEDHFKLKGMR